MSRQVYGESPSEQLKAGMVQGICMGIENGQVLITLNGADDYHAFPETARKIAADIVKLADIIEGKLPREALKDDQG